jgi:hypothetical protein
MRLVDWVQFVADQIGAVFEPLFAPGDIDENLLHRAGRGLEEMPAIGEVLLTVTGNLQPGLVHERRGLQGLSGFLMGHPDDGEFAQFLIDQREQLISRCRIARINGAEQLGDFGHEGDGSRAHDKKQQRMPSFNDASVSTWARPFP